MEKILLLEDEEQLGRNLKMVLGSEGYHVEHYRSGDEAVTAALEKEHDLMILDVMLKPLPDKPLSNINNGLEVVRVVSQQKTIPYILVTSRNEPIDILQGLNMGADDYITKPYDLSILLARVRAVLRRYNSMKQETNIIEHNDIKVDLLGHKVMKGDNVVELTNQLFEILHYFIKNKHKVVTRDELYKNIWGYEPEDTRLTNTLEVNIRRLRYKIGPEYIKTVRGAGYKLE